MVEICADYLSVMHYDKTAFATDPAKPTMVTIDPKFEVIFSCFLQLKRSKIRKKIFENLEFENRFKIRKFRT